jgi:predicted nucleotidyltransferase
MPVPPFVGGVLPQGRYQCTQDEIEAFFVNDPSFVASISRPAIWQHWETGLELLTSAVTVHSAWIGGSFVTAKLTPRDIDVLFIVSEEDRAKRGVEDRQVIESFMNRVRDPLTGHLKPAHGLLVDSYVINWSPHNPAPDGKRTPLHFAYAAERGYWDDWWSRKRVTSKKKPSVREDALPKRGFLEVILNDYV